ncbi:MAG: NOB1 family endonuclease [Candidatus Thorarchaeota archaeon]
MEYEKKIKTYIFDTNIFLTGIDFNLFEGIIYTTPSVIEEVRDYRYQVKNRNIVHKIYAAIESKKLKIKFPEENYIEKVNEISKKTGDFKALSIVDKELIALCLELTEKPNYKVKIYSNDYSVENVCSELRVPFSPLYKEGIEDKITWQIYCPQCQTIHKVEDLNKVCEICGSILKRRPKK